MSSYSATSAISVLQMSRKIHSLCAKRLPDNSTGRGRQGDYSITLTINYLKFSYPGGGDRRIFNFKTANSRRALFATSTQYVKRDVTLPRLQLGELIKRNSRPTCKRWPNIRARVNDHGIVREIPLTRTRGARARTCTTFFGDDAPS